MSVREPGSPRPNPLFERPEEGGAGFRLPVDPVLDALYDVQPEAVDHVLAAAQEMLAAAKALVESAEQAVERQRDRLRERAAESGEREPDGREAASTDPPRIRRIDLG